MPTASDISFYVDTLLVETVLTERFYKKAGVISDALSGAKEYLESKIDKNHPTTSVLNLLAPAGISMLFSVIGFGKFGLLLGLLTTVFHVDVVSMVKSLYEKVKEMLGSGRKISHNQVDRAVNTVIQEHSTEATTQEAEKGYEALQQRQQAPINKVYSSLELMYDAKIMSLALIEYEKQNMRLIKDAAPISFLKNFSGTKVRGTSLLGRILGWIFKFALTAAGLLTVGAVIDHFMGGSSTSSSNTPASTALTSTQNKYHFIGDAPLPREISITNTPDNIGNMIIQFAKDTYAGLDGKENLIQNTAGFKIVKQKIVWTNLYNRGSSTVMIPPVFTSKKQLVDYFIDDVAMADTA